LLLIAKGILANPVELSEVEFADMNAWNKRGPANQSNWTVLTGGRTVKQTVNGQPSFFVTTKDYINVTIMGTIEVDTNNDDDMIGVVVGYQNPNSAPATNTALDYEMVLFDWKQASQSFSGVTSFEGITLGYLNGNMNTDNDDKDYFWIHENQTTVPTTGSFNLLLSDYTYAGWKDKTQYSFRIIHTTNAVRVRINNQLVIDQTVTAAGGKVGFYNNSQENVIYGNVRLAPSSDTPSPPVASADSYGTSTNTTLSKNRLEGIVANDYDPNLDLFRINIVSSGNFTGSFNSDDENQVFQTTNGNISLSGNGKFSYTPATGYEGLDSFSYSVTDKWTTTPDGTSSNVIVQFYTVANNSTPTDITLSSNIIDLHGSDGLIIGYLSTVDADVGDIHDYSMSTQSTSTLISLSGNSIKIFDKNVRGATNSTHTITVLVTDANGATFTKTLNLIVRDLRPILTLLNSSSNYTENASAVVLDPSLTISDNNDLELIGANINISSNFLSGDNLTITSLANITSSFNSSTGSLVLAGNATLSQYEIALESLSFLQNTDNPTNYGANIQREIQYLLYDSSGNGESLSLTLTVNASNDVPVIGTLNSTATFTENGSSQSVDSTLTLSDVDNLYIQGANITISVNALSLDILNSTVGATSITSSYNTSTYLLTLSGNDSLANYETVLESITFSNNSENPDNYGTQINRLLSYEVYDTEGNSSVEFSSLAINVVNDKPSFSLFDNISTYTEGSANIAVDTTLTLSDIDSTHLSTANIIISANFLSGDNLIVSLGNSGLNSSFDASQGVLSLAGTATLAVYESVLETLSYSSNNENLDNYGQTLARKLQLTIVDSGSLSFSNNTFLNIIAVNDAPVLSALNSSGNYTENNASLTIDTSINLSDVDDLYFQGANITISTNGLSSDSLSATVSNTQITASYDSANLLLSLSGNDTLANYKNVLESIVFINPTENPSTFGTQSERELKYQLFDNTSISNNVITAFGIVAVGDAPVLNAFDTAPIFTEQGSAVILDNSLTFSDIDSINLIGANISISANFLEGDFLGVTLGVSGLSSSYDSALGILTLSGSANITVYESIAETVYFSSSNQNPDYYGFISDRNITMSIYDELSLSANSNIVTTIIGVNDAPSITWTDNSKNYQEHDPWLNLSANLITLDIDSLELKGANIIISDNLVNGDELKLGTVSSNIFAFAYESTTGSIRISGNASLSDYQTYMRTLCYRHTGENPDVTGINANRKVSITIYDTGGLSSEANIKLKTLGINDAPFFENLQGATPGFAEGGGSVFCDTDLVVKDEDHEYIQGVTVAILQGSIFETLSINVGTTGLTASYNSASANLTITGNASKADYQAVLRSIKYNNTDNNPTVYTSSIVKTITYNINDGLNWGESQTILMTLVPFNNSPILSLNNTSTNFIENTSLILEPSLSLSDVDNLYLSSAKISISGNYENGDVISSANTNRITVSFDTVSGIYIAQGNALISEYQSLLRTVIFSVAGDNPDIYTTNKRRELQFSVYDGFTWSVPSVQTVIIIPINDKPGLSVPVITNIGYAEGGDASQIWAGITLADPDHLNLTSANIQISSPQLTDVLSVSVGITGITASFNGTQGLLSLTGSSNIANYQKVLRTATYSSTSNNPTHYSTKLTRRINIEVSDGDLNSGNTEIIVTLYPTNNRPELLFLDGKVDFIENASNLQLDTDLIVKDVDDLNCQKAFVYLTSGNTEGDILTANIGSSGLTINYDTPAGILTIDGNTILSHYQDILRTLSYINTSDNPDLSGSQKARTVQYLITDGVSWSKASEITISILSENDPPSAFVQDLSYIENQGSAKPFQNIVLNDVENDTISQARIKISDLHSSDSMSFTPYNGLSYVLDSSTYELRLSGVASMSVYQSVISSIVYRNSSDNPDSYGTHKTRSMSYELYDGKNWSSANNLTVNIIAVNDPPVLTTANTLADYKLYSGAKWEWNYSVYDPDDKVLNHEPNNLFSWMSLDQSTQVIQGSVPIIPKTQKNNITFKISDASGAFDSEVFSIEILVDEQTSSSSSLVRTGSVKIVNELGSPIKNARVELVGFKSLDTDKRGLVEFSLPINQTNDLILKASASGYISAESKSSLPINQILTIVLKQGGVRIFGKVTVGSKYLSAAQVVANHGKHGNFSTLTSVDGSFEIYVNEALIKEEWQIGSNKAGYDFKVIGFTLIPGEKEKEINLNSFSLSEETLFGYEVHKADDYASSGIYHIAITAEPNFSSGDELLSSFTGIDKQYLSSLRYDVDKKMMIFDFKVPSNQSEASVNFSFNAQPKNGLKGTTDIFFTLDQAVAAKDNTEAKIQKMVNIVRGGKSDLSNQLIIDDNGLSITDHSGFEVPPFGVSSNVKYVVFERTSQRIQHYQSSDFVGAIYTVDAYTVLENNGVKKVELLESKNQVSEIYLSFIFDPVNWEPYVNKIYYSENQGVSWIEFPNEKILFVDYHKNVVTIVSDHLSLWVLGEPGKGLIGNAGGGSGGGCFLKINKKL